MGLKVIVCDCVFTDREVELPDTCPKCGADLTEQYMEGNWHDIYDIVTLADGEEVEREWDKNHNGDGYYVMSYWCPKCQEELVSGEETHNEKG